MSGNQPALMIFDWAGRDEYPPRDGVYANVDAELYHADKTRMSKSQLGHVARSIAHWWADQWSDDAQSEPQRWGSEFHAMMEGKSDFYATYAPGPDARRSSKIWKQAELDPALGGRTLLNPREWDELTKDTASAVQAVRDHEITGPIVNSPTLLRELTINFRYKDVPLRSRLDGYDVQSYWIHDLKRTVDARSDAFRKAAGKYGYDAQDFMYTTAARAAGLPVHRFVFVCVEPKAPYATMAYTLNQEFKDRGEQKIIAALEKWRQYVAAEDSRPPGYQAGGIYEISPTRWVDDQWEGITGVIESD